MTNRPTNRTLQFRPEWRLTAFTLVLLPLLIALGFWQLQRAQEKRQIADSWQQRRSTAAVPLGALRGGPGELAWRRIELRGHFLAGRDFLLDNKIHKQQFGYQVLTPFMNEGDQLVLVNRGWLAGDPARRSLPSIPEVQGPRVVTGHVYVAPGEPVLLMEQDWGDSWPRVIQAADMALFAESLERQPFAYLIRIDDLEAGALKVDWQIMTSSPERHTGYAVQWFAMALALLLLYVFHSTNLWQHWRGTGR